MHKDIFDIANKESTRLLHRILIAAQAWKSARADSELALCEKKFLGRKYNVAYDTMYIHDIDRHYVDHFLSAYTKRLELVQDIKKPNAAGVAALKRRIEVLNRWSEDQRWILVGGLYSNREDTIEIYYDLSKKAVVDVIHSHLN